ncbi:MAG: amylo-alpha-1,6-glucosidase [Planctomycetota bacterium]|nr:amylo-alpha-1,6-glucosidase [Planctomycetota bacterium]
MPLYSVETYGELQPHLNEEWLVTNGLGGVACGTVVGCNTRRYHGLLCAATIPPVGRVMLLNRIGEILRVEGQADRLLEFSINQFGNTFHPRGDQYLQRFDQDDVVARWEYDIEGIRIVKELQMPWLNNASGIRYSIDPGGRSVELALLPFVRLLDFHSLRRGKTEFEESRGQRNCWLKSPSGQVSIEADAGTFEIQPDWWFGHTFAIETERGLDDTEDLYTPGRFSITAKAFSTITLWASTHKGETFDWDEQVIRRRAAVAAARTHPANVAAPGARALGCLWESPSPALRQLAHAANDFVVYRKSPDGKDGASVIAGYPWFSDWGRDTMISLPGLLLATGRFEQARQVLCVFAQYVSEGMIPNRFDDYTSEPSYNTVDASLWFIHAVFEYARLSGDTQTLEANLRPACRAIIEGYTRGTRFNIRVDPADGLVSQGDPSTQLTWMDAKCDGVCFTPRQGKPVEINALWYHGLKLMGDDKEALRVKESFVRAFWLSPFRGLADVVDGTRRDASIRPNQIFAVSLSNSPLSADQQRAVVETVRRELLTPVGLRTLARSDSRYRGTYRGSPRQRDEAYHNGTVWPWPIGAFLQAYLKVNEHSAESIDQARRWLEPLLESMRHACIGQISEIFEGDEPHRPVGCFAQAWSIAETLRLALELGM